MSPFPATLVNQGDARLRNPLDGDVDTNKDMLVNGSGTPVEFEFRPMTGEQFYIEYVTILLIMNSLDTSVGAGFAGNLTPLANGLLLHGQQNGNVSEVTNLRTNMDVFQCFFGGTGTAGSGSNQGFFDTGKWIGGRYVFRTPFFLDGTKGDFISFRVRDNLLAVAQELQSSFRTSDELPPF